MEVTLGDIVKAAMAQGMDWDTPVRFEGMPLSDVMVRRWDQSRPEEEGLTDYINLGEA